MSEFTLPSLPPLYEGALVPFGTSPFAAACESARGGGDPGQLLMAARADRADFAVTLVPEEPYSAACRIAFLAQVGLGDALGALVPPAVDVQFGWPDRIDVNGASVGGLRLALPPDPREDPAWAVLGITLQVAMEPGDNNPGRDRRRTSLHDEGCGDVTAVAIVESFSRHFLYWINRYQDEGFAPVLKHWVARVCNNGGDETVIIAGHEVGGKDFEIDDGGNVLLRHHGKALGFTLADALTEPTWSLKGS